jgi:hypothetical protein
MNKKKKEELFVSAWSEGFDSGIQVGIIEAVGILILQKEKHGNLAGIDDLIKLIKDRTPEIVESYRD